MLAQVLTDKSVLKVSSPMKITMIGTGYVGLVSGVCFADNGFDVTCLDIDKDKITGLKNGQVPIYEPGLDALIKRNVGTGRLSFSTDFEQALALADVVFLAVGTPSRIGGGEADLSSLFESVRQMTPHLKDGVVIVTKSTVVVGTNQRICDIIGEINPSLTFSIASNPEFLREGCAIDDFVKPDRVVVGVQDLHGEKTMRVLYRPLNLPEERFVVTSLENAELIKYAANAFLAMKVTFINEVANLCEVTGGDVSQVARAIGLDSRIGPKFLQAGPGIGGSCFPKDTRAYAAMGMKYRAPQRLIETVIQVNEARKISIADQIVDLLKKPINKTVGVLGLAFKPGTDDVREAPSLTIVPRLIENGIKVRAYDPQAMAAAKPMLEGVIWCDDALSVANDADLIVVLTHWEEFKGLDLGDVAQRMKGRLLFDTRALFEECEVTDAGLELICVGRVSGR